MQAEGKRGKKYQTARENKRANNTIQKKGESKRQNNTLIFAVFRKMFDQTHLLDFFPFFLSHFLSFFCALLLQDLTMVDHTQTLKGSFFYVHVNCNSQIESGVKTMTCWENVARRNLSGIGCDWPVILHQTEMSAKCSDYVRDRERQRGTERDREREFGKCSDYARIRFEFFIKQSNGGISLIIVGLNSA